MTTKKDNPCKDCSDRFVGCHSNCERYLAWKKAYDEWSNKVFTERTKSRVLDKYLIDRRLKAKNEYRRKSK